MWKYVERVMRQKGLRIVDIQRGTDIPYSTLTDWKAGRYTPKADKLQKIADFLGVSVEYLNTGKHPERTSDSGKSYHFSDETAALAQEMLDDPKYKILMSSSRKLNTEDLTAVQTMIDALLRKEGHHE